MPSRRHPRRPQYHCSQMQVFGLLHELLLRVLPHDAWGSAHNRRKVMRSVKRSLGMGHHDAVGLREMLSGVRVKDCAWLHLGGGRPSPSEHRKCEELLAQFVSWLMTDFIMEAIRSFFYVTITNCTKNHLLYFRKKAWARLLHTDSRKFVVQGKLQELTDMERQNVLRGDAVIPVSFLRFLPQVRLGAASHHLHAAQEAGSAAQEEGRECAKGHQVGVCGAEPRGHSGPGLAGFLRAGERRYLPEVVRLRPPTPFPRAAALLCQGGSIAPSAPLSEAFSCSVHGASAQR
ncbi:telomerase reverse transcriptase-like [Petromyzon marinus]|uniref:telomerase reverse transcriptase-like n=1 Tax=Petromyzon marinus TaxID=7757 RepID=UPI003F714372